jgi:hypothetical protein
MLPMPERISQARGRIVEYSKEELAPLIESLSQFPPEVEKSQSRPPTAQGPVN